MEQKGFVSCTLGVALSCLAVVGCSISSGERGEHRVVTGFEPQPALSGEVASELAMQEDEAYQAMMGMLAPATFGCPLRDCNVPVSETGQYCYQVVKVEYCTISGGVMSCCTTKCMFEGASGRILSNAIADWDAAYNRCPVHPTCILGTNETHWRTFEWCSSSWCPDGPALSSKVFVSDVYTVCTSTPIPTTDLVTYYGNPLKLPCTNCAGETSHTVYPCCATCCLSLICADKDNGPGVQGVGTSCDF